MDSLREKIAKLFYQYAHCGIPDEYETEWLRESECIRQTCQSFAKSALDIFPDIEELKKEIDIKRTNAFSVSLFGDREHQIKMDAMVNAYDVVLNLIKDIGGK